MTNTVQTTYSTLCLDGLTLRRVYGFKGSRVEWCDCIRVQGPNDHPDSVKEVNMYAIPNC